MVRSYKKDVLKVRPYIRKYTGEKRYEIYANKLLIGDFSEITKARKFLKTFKKMHRWRW